MAGVGFKITKSAVATGTAAKTIIQVVAAANHAVLIKEMSVAFAGTSNTAAPILVEVVRQTDAGTSTALTPVKDPDDSAETLQSTARHTATAEPTTTDVLMSEYVHPQTGYTWQAPFGQAIKVGGGDRVGIRVTAGADISSSARMVCEE
jgi:hypothetical protein